MEADSFGKKECTWIVVFKHNAASSSRVLKTVMITKHKVDKVVHCLIVIKHSNRIIYPHIAKIRKNGAPGNHDVDSIPLFLSLS